ncbi:MAG: hypothetical protein OEV68_05545, partial [candidate division Zixibacteria bacterium]|nr:hypothetical protein [candidate division Zixibacteria bacterium]
MRIRCIVFVTLLFMGAYGLVGAQSISLDHTDGLADATHMNTGVPVIFYLRLTGDADAHGGVANGFKVYSPDGATWTTSVGDTTGTLGKTQFDGGFFINPFSITGSNADTLGFAGFRFFGAGLPIGFDDVAYTIEIGPIPAGDAGKQICLDSAFYPPSGVWKWAGVDVFPDWDGPHCFTVGAAAECVVDVTFPNGGETVTVGDGMNITWTTADCLDCDFVDISYSVDGGGFTTIVSGTPNDGSHGWTAPDEQSSNVVVKVCCQASGHCAESGPFTIEAIPCTIVVTSPSNGDTWTHGDLVSIQWTSDCPCDMNIQISVDGGTSWGYLAGPMANSGQFDWTVTDAYESNTVKVRVLCTDASASGASDGLFSIVAPPPTNIVLSIPVMTGDNCDSVCIPITADAFTGVAGVELHLNYDPACMTCIGIDPGVLAGATVNCDAGGAHIIWEDFANPLTLPDGATIASVCFTGLSEAVCAVGFDETCELVDEVGDPLVASYNDGSLNCEPPPPSDIMLTLPNMTADNCDSACIPITVESFEGVAGVELHLNYDASCMLCADIDVGYLAGATVNCEEGAVHIIWEDFANPLSLPDGETLASVCFTGLSEAACSVGFDATSELVDELGDPLAASYNDGSLNCEPPPPSDIMLTLPNMTADNCDSACIPITVESFAGVAGVELHLNYDASCMLCADIDVGYLAGATVNCEEGAVHIIWEDFANPLSLPDGETLASVCFTGLSEAACPVGFDATSELVDELGDPLAASYNDGSLNCTPVPECVTTVVNPNGGEVLTVGETVQIQWTYTDGPPGAACECDAFIEFTTDGGTTWITIDPGAPGGTYDWVVPDRPSATCLIRVCCNGPQWICDVSDNFFTIQGPPPSDIVLTLPEMVADNCDYACIPVTVEGFNGVAGVELHFDYDAGCMTCSDFDLGYLTGATVNCEEGAVHIIWEDFANPLTLPDGETLVSICFDALSESACPIGFTATSELVDELGDPLAASYNDGSLSCTPGAPCVATVISPNGGETWTVGDVVEINWTLVDATPADSFDCPATIDISFDGGATWTNIATNQVGSSFNWTVTDNPSTNCLIRGCCCAPDAECDVSDAPFTIQAPQGGCVPPAICLDHVDGLDAANKLIAGGSARFHLRVKGDADEHGGVANGFRVFSPDGATWSLTIGDTTGTLGKTQFDGGFFINDFSITGMDADTIGFGGFRFFSTGLPPLFNDIAYTLVIGPIGAGDAGKNICLDSAFYPPSGVWKWAGIDIFPNWDGPHCYEISGEQQPCTLAVTSPIAGDSLEIGSTWPITWETDCDCSYTIEVSTDGGANWNAVASGVPGSPFNWTVPNSPTEFALVRVCCDDGSTCDASGRFTIYETPPPPRIVLTVPDVVVDGCGNGCVPILVQSFNAVAGVELHLTFDDACMDCDV